jgi:hypothetical protein
MTTDKRENSIHIRISDEADQALELLAMVHPDNAVKSVIAASIIERALLGEVHAPRMAINRYARKGLTGKDGE